MILKNRMTICISVKGSFCNGCNFESEDGECILFERELELYEDKRCSECNRCAECLKIFGIKDKRGQR